MTFRQFIKDNREELDRAIRRALSHQNEGHNVPRVRFNDKDREQWILNDEGLYNWARSAGVNI